MLAWRKRGIWDAARVEVVRVSNAEIHLKVVTSNRETSVNTIDLPGELPDRATSDEIKAEFQRLSDSAATMWIAPEGVRIQLILYFLAFVVLPLTAFPSVEHFFFPGGTRKPNLKMNMV